MDVKEMVLKHLQSKRFDGLCNSEGECGCTIKDFMPCGGDAVTECEAAYAWSPEAFKKANEVNEYCLYWDDDCDYIMSPDKPTTRQRYSI